MIRFRPRTVLAVLGIVIAVVVILRLLWLAHTVLTWVLIAVFLSLALNPLVVWVQRHVVHRRGAAVAVTMVSALAVVATLGGLFVPVVVGQLGDFVDAVPDYVADLTAGRGPLGFLETEYHIVERLRESIESGGTGRILGYSGTAFAITKSVVTVIVAAITIVVLVIFMLLEGPRWIERGLSLLPPESEERWRRIGEKVNVTVGGYVSGALLIALIAGVVSSIALSIAGVPYALALGLLVALLDLVPLAGATIATVLVSTIAFLDSVPVGIAILIFFVLYQQLENHVLYPVVYSRTVELSPLVILIAVLVGASLAGIIGALAAIPVAGTIQVLVLEWFDYRRERLTSSRPEGTTI